MAAFLVVGVVSRLGNGRGTSQRLIVMSYRFPLFILLNAGSIGDDVRLGLSRLRAIPDHLLMANRVLLLSITFLARVQSKSSSTTDHL